MKTVHGFFTNIRMNGAIFVHSWFYSWMVSCFAGVVARVVTESVEVSRVCEEELGI